MNFKDLSPEQKKELSDLMFKKLDSAQELKEWVMAFLGLDMPIHSVDPDSNSSPVDAMWAIYETVKNNTGDVTPGFIMLSARECYKCQVKGSKLLTPNGLVNIEDVRIGDTVWSGWAWRKVTNHIYDGLKAGITVQVDGGLEFTGSPIHRYWALRDGKEQWIRSNELNPEKDLVAINVNTGLKGQFDVVQSEYDLGYFLGILAGDGSVSSIDSPTHAHFGFTTIDDGMKKFFYDFVASNFQSRVTVGSDRITHCVWDKKAIEKLKEWGVKAARAWEKVIPSVVHSSVSSMKGFIAGLIDTDGSFSKQGHLVLSITSLELLKEVQKCLTALGVLSRVRTNARLYSNQKHLVSTLTVAQSELGTLFSSGISLRAKKANFPGRPSIPNTHDALPTHQVAWFLDIVKHYSNVRIKGRTHKKPKYSAYETISVSKLEAMCDWMDETSALSGRVSQEHLAGIAQMRSILKNKWCKFTLKNEDSVEFYDLTVEVDHSYWSNGSISHNTLGASILEVLLMLHFEVTIAHMAAILSQSSKAIQYINYFFGKVQPLLEARGWVNTSQNKNKIEYRTPEGEDVYIRVIVCTLGGANCVDPAALVMVEGKGPTPAVEVSPGDRILTRDYKNGKDVYVTSAGMGVVTKPARRIKTKLGRSLVVSDDHPIFTDGGWIRASKARIGTKLIVNTELPQQESVAWQETVADADLDQIILGTLLGDASLHLLPSGSIRYSLFQSAKCLDYLKYVSNALLQAGIKSNLCKDGSGYRLTSSISEKFIPYYELTIKNGKKTVTREWLERLSEEGIAHWLMNDGSGNPEKVGSYKEHCLRIATCGFSLEENWIIANFLTEKGYESTVKNVSNQSKRVYPYISVALEDSRKLSKDTSFYFQKCYRYKLLSTKEEADDRWETDTGHKVSCPGLSVKKMSWGKKPNTRSERAARDAIVAQLNDEIESIELLGYVDLVDISVETEDRTLHSFYANGLLVHNSEHTSLMFVDEIDVVKDPMAYEEAKMIPGFTKGIHPLTVKLSTRKFSFGLMQAEIDKAAPGPESSGDKIVRWNILDVTERCPETRHKPELPKVDLYAAKSLPLRHITPSEYAALSDVEKPKWELVPQAHGGCQDCKLFAVCKTRLSQRGPEATKGLYKPISAVINNFKKLNPDMAEAQLMCWKPSSKGLVYPRFETAGNTIQLMDAFKTLLGEDMKDTAREIGWNMPSRLTTDDLIDLMKKLKIDFYAGVDWGYTHDFVIVIFAKIPNGEIWIVDCYSAAGLEFSDCLDVAKVYRDKYAPTKWFCDQAMPSHIKSFTKNGMKSPSFTKDVMGGIEALRSKIVDGAGRRYLKILVREDGANMKVVSAFQKHHFKLGPDGNPTLVPDDTPGTADQADAMRYVAQNLFPVKGTQKINATYAGGEQPLAHQHPTHTNQMKEEVLKRIQGGNQPTSGGSGRKGGFHFNF